MELDLSRAQWRKSSYSGNTGNCVEVANLGKVIAVRDSASRDDRKLIIKHSEWRAFIEFVRDVYKRA
jgi:hypothetical protein